MSRRPFRDRLDELGADTYARSDDYGDDYGPAWVCTDCYFAHHYGAHEHNGEWFAGESDSPCDREPLKLLEGYELADNTDSETGEGMDEFSWRSCDGCGSTLGGSRHRLAVFAAAR